MVTKVKNWMQNELFQGIGLIAIACIVLVITLLVGTNAPIAAAPTKPIHTTPNVIQLGLPQTALSSDDFTYKNGYLVCSAANTMMGIDVSHHQQDIDWQQVAQAGVEFVMVRLGYRGLNGQGMYEDRYVQQNLTGAREAGILVGAYFYSQAITPEEAEEEARYALEILGDFQLDLPLVYDWEQEYRTENMATKEVTACSAAFCHIIEEAGIQPMIYFNSYQAVNLMELDYLTEYPWWLAMYDTEAEFPCRFDIWQYSSTGSVPGIEGNVDLDILILPE